MESIGLAAILDDRNFQAGLKRYTAGLGQMTKLTDGAAKVLSGAFFAATGIAVAGLGAMVAASKLGLDATMEWAEQLDKLGDQFGLSGEKASGWAFLMNKVGLSVDEGAQGLNYFTKQLDDFGKATATGKATVTPFMTALQKLGVNAYDAGGKLKDFDTIMPEIMDQFEKLPAGVNASALAMDLFGARGGTKFLDFLRQGGAGLKEATEKAKELGLELSTDEVNAAEAFGFALNELKLSLSGVWNIIGRAVLPVARDFVNLLNDKVVPVLANLARQVAPLLAQALQGIVNQLFNLGNWIQTVGVPWVERFANAFRQGGLAGVLREAANLAGALAGELAKRWPEIQATLRSWGQRFWDWVTTDALPALGGKLGQLLAGIQTWAATNGPAIGKAFMVIGESFWDWLFDSKSGVIPRIGAVLGNWVYMMQLWASNPKNTEPIWTAMQSWAGLFWQWVTGKGGVIDTLATAMDQIVPALNAWLTDPNTAKALEDVGRGIATTIIDGIGKLFSGDQGQSDSAMNHLIRSLNQARINLASGIAGLGANLATDLAAGIVNYFTGGSLTESLRAALYTWLKAAIDALIFNNIGALVDLIMNAIKNKLGGGQSPAPSEPYSPLPKYQHGGYVPQTGLALLHQGEYVIPASQVSNVVNNYRSIGAGAITFQIQGGTSLTERQLENVAFRVVERVMNAA